MGGWEKGELVEFARDLLIDEVSAAQFRIWLTAPFLTLPVAQRIAQAAAESSAAQRRLLTALDARSVQVGVLSPKALLTLQEAKFEIRSITNLHAKVSIVDREWALVGSGNLTGAGLGHAHGGNRELGVILDADQIRSAVEIVTAWWTKAKPVTKAEIDRYAAMPRAPKAPLPDFGGSLAVSDTGLLPEILALGPEATPGRRYWVDANYHDAADERWWRRDWISDQPKVSYEQGDLIVIYLGGENDGPKACPAVLEATTPTRHDPRWVIEHRDPEAAERWPNVTETRIVAETTPSAGAPLDLIGRSGQALQRGSLQVSWEEFATLASAIVARANEAG